MITEVTATLQVRALVPQMLAKMYQSTVIVTVIVIHGDLTSLGVTEMSSVLSMPNYMLQRATVNTPHHGNF